MSNITPEVLAAQLAEDLPQKLKCVVLFGSAAAGDFVPGTSNYNVLIVAECLGIEELDALSSTVAEWCETGQPTPLMFTLQQLLESTDAFPIELRDIQQSRRVLWGQDLLADIRVTSADFRRQVERELTGKLLKLRARYLLTRGRPEAVSALMLRSHSTFLVLFRAALRLYEEQVPETKLEALHALAKHVKFDRRPFVRLMDLKQRTGESRSTLPDVTFASYLSAIESVANTINGFNQSNRSEA